MTLLKTLTTGFMSQNQNQITTSPKAELLGVTSLTCFVSSMAHRCSKSEKT